MIKIPGYDFDDRWILSLRGEKNPNDPVKPYLFFQEKELTSSGSIEEVNTIFLSNSECSFKCLMCDLWKNTTDFKVKSGDITKQIKWANAHLGPARHIKLYNSGNFFDRSAIPVEDYEEIAVLLDGFETVIVESHPKLIGDLCLHFNELVNGKLQVAIGLETTHPDILPLLNKRMDLNEFRQAVKFLNRNGIGSRAFILLRRWNAQIKMPAITSRSSTVEPTKSCCLNRLAGFIVLAPLARIVAHPKSRRGDYLLCSCAWPPWVERRSVHRAR